MLVTPAMGVPGVAKKICNEIIINQRKENNNRTKVKSLQTFYFYRETTDSCKIILCDSDQTREHSNV